MVLPSAPGRRAARRPSRAANGDYVAVYATFSPIRGAEGGLLARLRRAQVAPRRLADRVHQLEDQAGPGEVRGAEALAGPRVVVLAKALAEHGFAQPSRHLLRLAAVAQADKPDPEHPGRVDPRGSAPVAALPAAPAPRLEAPLSSGDGGRRYR